LSFLKSAMVLKSGVRRPVSHISSTLRWVSRSSRRLDAIEPRLRLPEPFFGQTHSLLRDTKITRGTRMQSNRRG
jgi:hypothetical protein